MLFSNEDVVVQLPILCILNNSRSVLSPNIKHIDLISEMRDNETKSDFKIALDFLSIVWKINQPDWTSKLAGLKNLSLNRG